MLTVAVRLHCANSVVASITALQSTISTTGVWCVSLLKAECWASMLTREKQSPHFLREAVWGAQWAAAGRVQGESLHSAGNHAPWRPLRAPAGAAPVHIPVHLLQNSCLQTGLHQTIEH